MENGESIDLWKYNLLPENLKQEIKDFIDFLFQKNNLNTQPDKKLKAGFLKGTFEIKEGFYDDLDDFKDYQ